MRVLIADLDTEALGRCDIAVGAEAVLSRIELEAAMPCTGCLDCWGPSPGRCTLPDNLRDLGALIGAADELVIVSEPVVGGLSPLIMRALERALPALSPLLHTADGDLRHRPRYAQGGGASLEIWLYGPTSPEERRCARGVGRCLAASLGRRLRAVCFSPDIERIGSAALARAHLSELPEGSLDPIGAPEGGGGGRAPRRIGLVNASPRQSGGAVSALLDDFREALVAYDRSSGTDIEPPELVDLAPGERARGKADAVVIGFPVIAGALPARLMGSIADGWAPVSPGGVYAIAATGSFEGDEARLAFGMLRLWCREHGLAWCGGLVIGAADSILPTLAGPRMGLLRRTRSEAMDRLIGAVRGGRDVLDAARSFGAPAQQVDDAARGIIAAPSPLPRLAHRLLTERRWKRTCRAAGAAIDAAPTWTSDR